MKVRSVRAKRRGQVSRSGEAGYSLLEVLIVVSIIAMIAAFVGPRLMGQLDRSKVTAARVQLRSLASSLETMRMDIGRYPSDSEGLDLLVHPSREDADLWRGPYIDADLPTDPWGGDYVYVAPTSDGDRPKLISYGADRKAGGKGLEADIAYGDPE